MCPASIYNYANTLHMLGDEKEAGKRLEVLLSGDAAALESGCPDGSLGYEASACTWPAEASEGCARIWSRRQVIAQLNKDDPDPESKAVARIERQTRAL